jgi:hypothetical protein
MPKIPYGVPPSKCTDKVLEPYLGSRCFHCRRVLAYIEDLRGCIWTGLKYAPLACRTCEDRAAGRLSWP